MIPDLGPWALAAIAVAMLAKALSLVLVVAAAMSGAIASVVAMASAKVVAGKKRDPYSREKDPFLEEHRAHFLERGPISKEKRNHWYKKDPFLWKKDQF